MGDLEKLFLQGDGAKMAEWLRRNMAQTEENDRRKQLMLLALSLDATARKYGLSGFDATGLCRRTVLHTSLHTLERQLTEGGAGDLPAADQCPKRPNFKGSAQRPAASGKKLPAASDD